MYNSNNTPFYNFNRIVLSSKCSFVAKTLSVVAITLSFVASIESVIAKTLFILSSK